MSTPLFPVPHRPSASAPTTTASRWRWLSIRSRLWRSLGAVVVGACSLAYAVFGNDLLTRGAGYLARGGQWVADVAGDVRHRSATGRLERSTDSFDKLTRCRDTVAEQMKTLQAQRDAMQARLREDTTLLEAIRAALDGKTAPEAAAQRSVVEHDAAAMVRCVEVQRLELAECEAALRRLNEDLVRLDREVDSARHALRQQAFDLERQRAANVGQRAYRDAIELARQLEESSK